MKTMHTPGPWSVAQDGTVRSRAWGESDMMGDYLGVIVCDLKAGTGAGEWPAAGRAHSQSEADANARLIAAAPDLRAACERLLACLGTLSGYDYTMSDDTDDAVEAARAAVAKARGDGS